jgi:hypothetical protein
VAEYGGLSVGDPIVKQVNMAEDPKGELNGWGVYAEITNTGAKTLEYVNVTVHFLAEDGTVLDRQDYPLVSMNWRTTATELQQTPIKPGEKRTWEWTFEFAKAAEGWNQRVKVFPSGLREVGTAAAP